MNAVCPSCGVAVVPGYVRCPKCQAGLPMGANKFRRVRRTHDPGGTSMVKEAFPILPVIAAVAVTALIIGYFALRGDDKPQQKLVTPARPNEAAPAVVVRVPAPAPAPAPPSAPTAPAPAVDPIAAAGDLERQLRRQRLWSSVQVTGARIEIRSGSCGDPLLVQTIDGSLATLRDGGLTRLRCVAQSGAVVFERDL